MIEIQDLSIGEIKSSIQYDMRKLDNIQSQIFSAMNLFNEKYSFLK